MNDLRQTVNTVPIWADNQGAVKLLKNPITSLRSKHIDCGPGLHGCYGLGP